MSKKSRKRFKVPYMRVYLPNKRPENIHSKLIAGITNRTVNGIMESLMIIISSLISKMPSLGLP